MQPSHAAPAPADLTLGNFFSAGWEDDWQKRQRPTGTPDMALLRVGTNFMEREFRANYFMQQNPGTSDTRALVDFDAFVAWSFNRRFMVETVGIYQWDDPRTGSGKNGGAPAIVGRFQLIDTETSSYAFQLKVTAPNEGLGSSQTTFGYSVAGFEDLGYWLGLDRTGLYYSVLLNNFDGPGAAGAKRNDCAYDVSVARTITDKETPLLGSLTLFVENFAVTDLDGGHAGRTLVSITPGVRFNLGRCERANIGLDNCIVLGVDIPVSTFQPWDVIYRFSYIKNF